jgi:hypothetical protein
MEPKAQAAERLLRGLGVAVKTFALYPPPHPVAARAVETLQAQLRAYAESFGPFAVRVTRHALAVDGVPYKTGPSANLAPFLFARKIAYFKILPAASAQAVATFVSTLSMERASLEAAGGVKYLLREAGVGNIHVTEMALEEGGTEAEPLDLSNVLELLGGTRPSPEERERVIEILHAGPESARSLLEGVFAAAGGDERWVEDGQVGAVYQALRDLDRIILDEPFEERPRLYANLAGGQVTLHEPLRSALVRTLVARGGGARVLGDALSSDQLAELAGDVAGGGNLAQGVTEFLRSLCADRAKARAVLAILDARLRPPGAPATWLSDTVWPELEPAESAPGPQIPFEFELDGGATAAPADWPVREGPADDDDEAVREVVRTLVDALRADAEGAAPRELTDMADALAGYLGWLVDHGDYAVLAEMLTMLRAMSNESGLHRRLAVRVLTHTAEGPLIDALVAALWENRKTVAESHIRESLQAMADHLVSPLVHALATEQRSGARAMLCDLIISLDGSRVDDLAGFVTDRRWYLVRNVANILGRLRRPQAVGHLRRIIRHPDYRVRRETLHALASIGTPDADAALAAFLDDPDERLRLLAIQSLDTLEAWRAMPRLLEILQQRDPFARQFEMKRAALEALGRLRAKQSLPVVRRLAGAWFVWGTRGRELRQAARVAMDVIEGSALVPERGPRGNMPERPQS